MHIANISPLYYCYSEISSNEMLISWFKFVTYIIHENKTNTQQGITISCNICNYVCINRTESNKECVFHSIRLTYELSLKTYFTKHGTKTQEAMVPNTARTIDSKAWNCTVEFTNWEYKFDMKKTIITYSIQYSIKKGPGAETSREVSDFGTKITQFQEA